MQHRPLLLLLLVLSIYSTTSLTARTQSSSRSRSRHVELRERERERERDAYSHDVGQCELEIHCKGTSDEEALEELNYTMPVKLPIRGPRGARGSQGEKGDRGSDGLPGLPGPPGSSLSADKKVAFFVGLTENFGPVTEHTNILFDRIITNIGSAYNPDTGKFTAPSRAVYQFNVVISAQGRQKAAVMVLKNGEMVATVWAESIPYWSTASNVAVLSLEPGDQVWLLLLSRASHLHGYMYTTFSGSVLFTL